MRGKLGSLMGGAALAALLILPSLTAEAKHMTAPPAPAAPASAPPAPVAPPAPPAAPAQANGDWVRQPVRTFNTTSLKVEDLVGTVTVDVKDSGPMTVEVSGTSRRVSHLGISDNGGELHIDGNGGDEDNSVWDWKNWFNFSDGGDRHTSNSLFVRISVPRGTEVRIEDLVGNANIGDTQGILHFDAAASTAHIGHLKEAHINVDGSGKIYVGNVDGLLAVDIGGSGKIFAGSATDVKTDIAGSGTVILGPVAHSLKLEIAGSGDVSAPRVNGPVSVDIEGSGSVKIADGTADPLHVEIAGAGNFTFGGTAVDPHIEAFGSGNVKIKAYRGKLNSEGMANVQIGQQ
ncbi:MAG TPA: DUF2807 domain-containing protein [Rhizomicrobium sp.]|jgi:hypothetical protein